jgi:gluconate 2-dehydrogenase gamma chain
MSQLTRREMLLMLGAAGVGAALGVSPTVVERVSRATRKATATGGFRPAFFTPHEWRTVRILADLVIPADERSGSATDAGVPEFMDFMLIERESMQTRMRGGLRWLDAEGVERFETPFADLDPADRSAILDAIAWPGRARAEMSQGVAFFTFFRDLTAAGFFSSRIGVDDLGYMGNRAVAEWNGCPPEALEHLGLDRV